MQSKHARPRKRSTVSKSQTQESQKSNRESITDHSMNFILPNIQNSSIATNLILGEGFGFNGNILETNILNLSVVVGIVVSLGGDALRELLDNRKAAILSTLSSSEERAKQAAETLAIAKNELAFAEKKALEIRENAKRAVLEVREQSNERRTQDIARLEETKTERTSSALLRAKSDLSSYTVKLALDRAKAKLDASLDPAFYEAINNSQLVLLTNWSL